MYVNDYAVMEINVSERVNVCICIPLTVHVCAYSVYTFLPAICRLDLNFSLCFLCSL